MKKLVSLTAFPIHKVQRTIRIFQWFGHKTLQTEIVFNKKSNSKSFVVKINQFKHFNRGEMGIAQLTNGCSLRQAFLSSASRPKAIPDITKPIQLLRIEFSAQRKMIVKLFERFHTQVMQSLSSKPFLFLGTT